MEYRIFLGKYRALTTKSPSWWETRRSHFGVTCEAEEMELGRKVVLESVPAFLLGETEREELRKAAAAAREIQHISIPALYEFGEEGEHFVYVTEYVHGLTAKSWVAAYGPMPTATALGLALQVVNAFRVAAQHGIHHPAIHPGNLMIVPDRAVEGGCPLVKVLHFFGSPRTVNAFDVSNPTYSSAASFVSPEQLAGASSDFQSETWSLGATLWFLLSATVPDKKRGVFPDQASAKFVGIPVRVRCLLAQMLAEDRDERPLDHTALEAEIRDCLAAVHLSEALNPVVRLRRTEPVPPAEQAELRPSKMKLLATAAGVATLALALFQLLVKPDRPVGLSATRNEKVEENRASPANMNFSVVPPAHLGASGQIPPSQPLAGAAAGRGTSRAAEPAPPAEGPEVPEAEAATKTGRHLPTRPANVAPPAEITTENESAGPRQRN